MSLINLITNTVEGVAQATVNTAKAAVGASIAPLDDGKTLEDGLTDAVKGLEKIGKP